MKGGSRKKTHFVFTYDSDATLLALIFKHRAELYHRGTTSKAWHHILAEFNQAHNAQIVQTRTLNNRFKALRKDLNSRITNNTMAAITTENEQLLILLNQHFSRQGGKVIEKERKNGHLLPMTHVSDSSDVYVHEGSPEAQTRPAGPARHGSNASQATANSSAVSLSVSASKESTNEGRAVNGDSDNSSLNMNGDVSPKISLEQQKDHRRPARADHGATPSSHSPKIYARRLTAKSSGHNGPRAHLQVKQHNIAAKDFSPRMLNELYPSSELPGSSMMYGGRPSQEMHKTQSLESLNDNISQFPAILTAPYPSAMYQDRNPRPVDRHPEEINFSKSQAFENAFTSPRAFYVEPQFIIHGDPELRPAPSLSQTGRLPSGMRPPDGAPPHAGVPKTRKSDPLTATQAAVAPQSPSIPPATAPNDIEGALSRLNHALDQFASLQSNQVQQNQVVTKLHKEFYDFKYEISSKLDQLLQSTKPVAPVQRNAQTEK